MRKPVLATFFALVCAPVLLGATCTLSSVTPNPNGMANRLQMDGTYSLAANETFLFVTAIAKLKNSNPAQFTHQQATINGNNWTANMYVAPATYECSGALYYTVNQ